MNKKQSLFHIAKRDTLPWYNAVLIRGGASEYARVKTVPDILYEEIGRAHV